MQKNSPRRVGVAIVGLGGAVATTAVAGVELLKQGKVKKTGLPLAEVNQDILVNYENLVFGGWDLFSASLSDAAAEHAVLTPEQREAVGPVLQSMQPWGAVGNAEFCKNVANGNDGNRMPLREQIASIKNDVSRFKTDSSLQDVVVINLASTERPVNTALDIFQSLDAFEDALDDSHSEISPAMLYAYAAIDSDCPYANFTPSVAADVPALIEYAERRGVPLAGKDGKTGQTMMKTVLAPAFRARALRVDGWYSTNILGNRDGLALEDPNSLSSKINTKGSVLDSILGYPVDNHVVEINYYKPRGDNKEAWDNIDVTGFLGQTMQVKVNFLCKDSVLAAPLVLEIARVMDYAKRRGQAGVVEELGSFFKAPMVANGHEPEHALYRQEQRLAEWLAEGVNPGAAATANDVDRARPPAADADAASDADALAEV